jgi:hypothetical protein
VEGIERAEAFWSPAAAAWSARVINASGTPSIFATNYEIRSSDSL